MDLLGIKDISAEQAREIIELAKKMKSGKVEKRLEGKTLIMLFEKPSTRTRLSFEAGMTRLGGHAIYMDFTTSQISRGETLADTAKVMSRYAEVIMARLFKHQSIEEIARSASVPVINALTDLEHPCQALGDMLTIEEYKGSAAGKKIVYVGDAANNVANSLMLAAVKLGAEMVLCCPSSYPPNREFVKEARKFGKVEITPDPKEAVKGADVIYTDVWVSMGMDAEKERRMRDFAPYQVNIGLLKQAKPDCMVMHCLPAHREKEITSEVLDSRQSAVWDQAENRLHIQNAIMVYLLENSD